MPVSFIDVLIFVNSSSFSIFCSFNNWLWENKIYYVVFTRDYKVFLDLNLSSVYFYFLIPIPDWVNAAFFYYGKMDEGLFEYP